MARICATSPRHVGIEHDMRVVAGRDWVIDIGPGAGDEGGGTVAAGPPRELVRAKASRTAPYLARFLGERVPGRGQLAG